MTKKEINNKLKKLGYGFVKVAINDWEDKVYKNYAGKSFKGFKGGSFGPMTATSAHINHNNSIESELSKYFNITKEAHGLRLFFENDKGKTEVIEFKWELFPTHHPSMNLDNSYNTFWLIRING